MRERAGRWIPPGKCLVAIALHFLDVWVPHVPDRLRPMGPIRRRDGGRCLVPGCTRPGVQVHHQVFRSRGGGDEPENLISLCPPHHLHGVHQGFVRVEPPTSCALPSFAGFPAWRDNTFHFLRDCVREVPCLLGGRPVPPRSRSPRCPGPPQPSRSCS